MSGACSSPPRSDAANTAIARGAPVGAEVRALEGVDGDIDFGQPLLPVRAAPDTLADEEHRGLVPLPLADDDQTVDRHAIEPLAHRLHRNPVGTMAIALTHRVRAGNRRLLDHIQKPVRELLAGGRHACTASRYGGSWQRVGLSVRYPSA